MAPVARRLRRAAARLAGEGLSLQDMARAHGPEAPGTLLLLMAAPCLLPVPGVGTVLGLGMAALAYGLWRGQAGNWLPRRVAGLVLSQQWTRRVLMFLVTTYLVAGRYARPRLTGVVASPDRSWFAATVAAMALLIVLPIPFGNVLPAVAMMLMGVALVFRDGLAMILGLATAALAVTVTSVLVFLAWDIGSGWLARVAA